MTAPRIVAEIGCNHGGSMETALAMIETAARVAGCDFVKFQKRSPRELLTPEQYDAPHPVPENAFGATYGEHRERLELSLDQHRELQAHCERVGIGYASSVWDLTSAREIASLRPGHIKIPSGSNLRFDVLHYLCETYPGEIHVSLGMTTRAEESRIVRFFVEHGRAADLVLYACTSGYPVAHEDICLLEIARLRDEHGDVVKAIGFSGHHLGIAADIGALTLGATWIERHYTLDRTWKGTDHAASLEPDGLRRLVRDCRAVSKALTHKPTELLAVELPQRAKLKRTA